MGHLADPPAFFHSSPSPQERDAYKDPLALQRAADATNLFVSKSKSSSSSLKTVSSWIQPVDPVLKWLAGVSGPAATARDILMPLDKIHKLRVPGGIKTLLPETSSVLREKTLRACLSTRRDQTEPFIEHSADLSKPFAGELLGSRGAKLFEHRRDHHRRLSQAGGQEKNEYDWPSVEGAFRIFVVRSRKVLTRFYFSLFPPLAAAVVSLSQKRKATRLDVDRLLLRAFRLTEVVDGDQHPLASTDPALAAHTLAIVSDLLEIVNKHASDSLFAYLTLACLLCRAKAAPSDLAWVVDLLDKGTAATPPHLRSGLTFDVMDAETQAILRLRTAVPPHVLSRCRKLTRGRYLRWVELEV